MAPRALQVLDLCSLSDSICFYSPTFLTLHLLHRPPLLPCIHQAYLLSLGHSSLDILMAYLLHVFVQLSPH